MIYSILSIIFQMILYVFLYVAYGWGWQYIICMIVIVGLMIVCGESSRNE
jgi:hypothetical protein